MKRMINSLRIDLRYMIVSYRFLISCVGLAIVSFLSVSEEIINNGSGSVYTYYTLYWYQPFYILYLLFSVIPGAVSFCIDWNTKHFRSVLLRSNKRIYAFSKTSACFIAGFLTTFIGQGLFLLALGIKFPYFIDNGNSTSGGIYTTLMNEQNIGVYFLIRILLQAMAAGFFAVFSLWLSTKITNYFVVLASPIILYYFIDNLFVALWLPTWFMPAKISQGLVKGNGILEIVLYCMCYFLLLGIMFSIAFYLSSKRRFEHG